MAEKHSEMISELLNDAMSGYRELKKLKEAGKANEIDYDYECVRDRKTVLAVKLISMDIIQEKMIMDRQKTKKLLGK